MKDELAIRLRKEAKSWAGWPHPTKLIAMLNEAADALEAKDREIAELKKREWVPVSERLPEPNEPILVANPLDGGVQCAVYDGGDINDGDGEGFNAWCGYTQHILSGVTHWMPLPEPPEQTV